MYTFITGTPGVGKTSLAQALSRHLHVPTVSLRDLLRAAGELNEWDENSRAHLVDPRASRPAVLSEFLAQFSSVPNVIVEGHIVELLPASLWDFILVLRTHPAIMKRRLETRDYSPDKISENLEAEILAAVAGEIAQLDHPHVMEITTGDRTVQECVDLVSPLIIESLDVPPEFQLGHINWLDQLLIEGTLYDYLPLDENRHF